VPVGGTEHEQRPAEPGRKPEQAADPDAQEAKDAPSSVMQADLELKWLPVGQPMDYACPGRKHGE
jgi:hypothetical protein